MGTLKAEAVVDKTTSNPEFDAASNLDEKSNHGTTREVDAAGSAVSGRSAPGEGEVKQDEDAERSIKRSIVSLLEPSVSPANDDQAALRRKARARAGKRGQKFTYVILLLASALLLAGAVYSLAQSDRFITDLTVVSFVLVLFFLIGMRIETTQGMLRELSDLVENRSGGGFDLTMSKDEIGTMDAAVARTLGRAGELQTLLRSEDMNFEKAYTSREERFRALLEDLACERAAITTSAEKLRVSMEGAHQNLANDLDAASRKFSQLMNDTSTALVTRIEDQLQKQSSEAIDICVKRLRSSLDGVLIRAVEQVDARGATLASLISTKSEEFDEKLLTFKKEVALSLNGQIDETQKAAASRVEAMTGSINRLLDRMNSGISERSESLNQMLATRVLEIASTLKLGKTEMLQTIESASIVSSDMSVKSEAANEILQKQVARLNENVVLPLGMLVEALKERSSNLSQDLAAQFESVNDALKTQASGLSILFERHIAKLKDTLASSSANFESAIESNKAAYESTLESLFKRHYRPLSEELATVRDEFAAQRRTFAPLIAGSNRNDRLVDRLPEPAAERPSERSQTRRLLPSATSRSSDVLETSEPQRAAKAERPARTSAPRESVTRETSIGPGPEAEAKLGQSWLTDILARASSDEEVATSQIEDDMDANIFSAISSNIETLVHTDRTAAAWASFKRKEPSRFHLIYTPQGEIVFDKLKTLLAADEDLRDSVVKYASRFESLLQDQFDDGDETTLFQYLSTSNGKVYTMLAHASNRLT